MTRRTGAIASTGGSITALAGLAAVAAAVLAGCGGSAGPITPTIAGPASATSGAPKPDTIAVETPGHDDYDMPGRLPPAAQAAPAASAFAVAWARPSLPADRWWAQIAPLCEQGFASALRTADPATLPASRVTGPPVAASPPAAGLAIYTVPTDGGTLNVTVAVIDSKWLVTDNDFLRAAQ